MPFNGKKRPRGPSILFDDKGKPFDNPDVEQIFGTVEGPFFRGKPGQPPRRIGNSFPYIPNRGANPQQTRSSGGSRRQTTSNDGGSFPSLFPDFLKDMPRAAFFSAPNIFGDSGRSVQQQRFFGQPGIFERVQDQFLGQLGDQLRGGQMPTLEFKDFLSQNFNPSRFFQRFGPSDQRSQFNPATRFSFF